MSKKILILGGGIQQVPLINKAKENGCSVYVSDYYEKTAGGLLADGSKQISTFSVEDNIIYAKDEKIERILTTGTDQPVYTAAAVSEILGLKHPITKEQAIYVTNKSYMKKLFLDNNINSPKYKIIQGTEKIDINGLHFPIVVKPVDSQGQRGIFVININENRKKIENKCNIAKNFSRTSTIILEEFCTGKEFTVNSWIKNGTAYTVLITDRLHFKNDKVLGVCKQHRYPSLVINSEKKIKKIEQIVQKICDSFKIKNGPLYLQMIINEEDINVVEFGYRIGGGFEAFFIPVMTGIDIIDLYYSLVVDGVNNYDSSLYKNIVNYGAINFIFSKPGKVRSIEFPEFHNNYGKIFIEPGANIDPIKDATSRVGYFIVAEHDYKTYKIKLDNIDTAVSIKDQNNLDLMYHGIYQ